MDEPDLVIRMRKVCTHFGSHVVHQDLDLDVRRGEIFAIVGGSGSGKTVLLREIIMLQRPNSGSVEVLGSDVGDLSPGQAFELRKRWGVMFQRGGLFSALTVRENVGLPLREYSGLDDALIDALAEWKLALTGLPADAGLKFPGELSGGMLKRASLARAIALDPELLFLDEPTSGLDPASSAGVDELIRRMHELLGLTIVIVTHDLDLLWQVCDRVAVLGEGRVLATGSMTELEHVEHPIVRSYFVDPRARKARARRGRLSRVDNKFSYAVVGAFVLALGAVLIAGVLWLAAGGTGKKRYEPYQVVFKESVSGLNVNAPVKYLGVDVGKVREIELDPKDPQQVNLTLQIERGTPVKQDTEAVLRTQGLTGIAYVDLSGGSPQSPPLVAPPDGGLPTIRSKPSLTTRIENVLTSVLGNIDRTSVSLNATLDAENRAAFKAMLADTALLVHTLAAQREAMAKTITGAARTADNAARASAELVPLMNRIAASADAVEKMAREAQLASASVGRAADAAGSGVRQINAEAVPELERLLGELNILAASLRRLADQTERDPSSLLRGPRTIAPGPGEKARP